MFNVDAVVADATYMCVDVVVDVVVYIIAYVVADVVAYVDVDAVVLDVD